MGAAGRIRLGVGEGAEVLARPEWRVTLSAAMLNRHFPMGSFPVSYVVMFF